MRRPKLTPIVFHILLWNEKARESDKILSVLVYNELGIDIQKSYMELMCNPCIPSVETIARVRRKLQEKNPNLRAKESIRKIRREEQDKFIAYAKGEIVI